MATAKIPIVYPIANRPHLPVTISNGDKKVTVNMLLDTGWEDNRLESKYGRLLGYTDTDILIKASDKNAYRATVKIGDMKPLDTILYISAPTAVAPNVFGALWMRQFDQFVITRGSVTATDSTTGSNTFGGLLQVQKDWNKYRHGIVGGPMLAATTNTAKKQALFAASRSNSSAYWRNRM